MALPVINNIAKIVVRGHIGSHPMQNVFHGGITSPLDQAEADAIGANLESAYAHLLPYMNASAGYDTIEVYDLAVAGGPQFTVLPATWPVVGAMTEGALPPQIAGLVALRGSSGGRSGRGRVYLGGFDEDASDGDSPSTACVGAMQDFGDEIVDWGSRIVSYYQGTTVATSGSRRKKPTLRETPVVTTITSAVARPFWASQRRRADLV